MHPAVEPSAARMYVGDVSVDAASLEAHDIKIAAVADVVGSVGKRGIASRRALFKPVAEGLASEVVEGEIELFAPGVALSTKACWFTAMQGQVMVVVVGAHEGRDVTDEVLAYALAWQHDRDLVLVVPSSHLGLTMERLPWIATPVRVFSHAPGHAPQPMVVPARIDVYAAAEQRPLHSGSDHDLGDRASLVDALVKRLDSHWALTSAHRSSYLAWHCLGRQVVQISRKAHSVFVTAGVAYTKPVNGQEAALAVTVSEPLSGVQLAEIERRVADAVWKRFAGHDQGHVEHRMQAALAATAMRRLGFVAFSREYPAWRGDGRPGFVDFLAIDHKNVLHVVETKVGTGDVKGVLQTLDYATWVTANAAQIRADLGWTDGPASGTESVVLDFVVAPKASGPAIGPYFFGQVEALDTSIAWRVTIVTDALAHTPELSQTTYQSIPPTGPLVATPVQGPRRANKVQYDFMHGQT